MHVEELGLKECERVMSAEIDNWVRWARQRNYLPASVACLLGRMYKPEPDEEEERVKRPAAPVEADAEMMEAIIVSLPLKLRRAFVLHHLDRGHIGQVTVNVKNRSDKARVLGVGARQWHYLLTQAHNLVLRRLRRVTYYDPLPEDE